MNLKKEVIIISIILGIVSLALIFIFILPFLNLIKCGPTELINVKKDLESFQNINDETGSIKNIYEEIKPNLGRINSLFADSESPVSLIKFFQNLAKTSSLNIKISPVPFEKGSEGYWSNLVFRLTLTGSYSNFMRFLEKIENGPYLIEDQELSIRKAVESGTDLSENINADLTIKVFVK